MTQTRTAYRWRTCDLDSLPDTPWLRYEILDGELIVSRRPHLQHSEIIARLVVFRHLANPRPRISRDAPHILVFVHVGAYEDTVLIRHLHEDLGLLLQLREGRPVHGESEPGGNRQHVVNDVVELLRQLMERQAIRRIEGGSLTEEEIERLGLTFLRLAERMEELKTQFGLDDEELNLDLGPLGDLL